MYVFLFSIPPCYLPFFHFLFFCFFFNQAGLQGSFILLLLFLLLSGDTQKLAAASILLFLFYSFFPSASHPIFFLTELQIVNAK